MLTPLVILGYGGLGREIALLIHQINQHRLQWELIGFLDDREIVDTTSLQLPRLGSIETLHELPLTVNVVIAIGQPNRRMDVLKRMNLNRTFPNLIHPTTVYSEENWKIGKGNIITSHCSFTTGISIGDFNLFNTKITVGHDVSIGSLNVFNPTVCVSGNVIIGDGNLLGVNSAILQGRKMGNHNILGAGSVLMSNVRNNETWFGVPALKSE